MKDGAIRRAPRAAARRSYDLVVVGGGIQGAMTALEAARRGYSPLLLERADFGGATSWNHLRILHGGLRYLQTADLRRFRESVAERRWLAREFPNLVAPLPCLLPLYGDGLRRPAVLRGALGLNDLLSARRNRGVPEGKRLPRGGVVDASETTRRFPAARRQGLRGAALWYDLSLERPQRLVMETLRWACAQGAECLNYVEAVELATEQGRVKGVEAVDVCSGDRLRFLAPRVLNCAGPWSRSLAADWHRDVPELFRPSIAFNLLLERRPPSDCALAVEPRSTGGRTYFLRPWRGRVLAGTYHAARDGGTGDVALDPEARPEEVDRFLGDLRQALPALDVRREEIVRVYAGFLPAAAAGTARLATRALIVDHRRRSGPAGLVSLSGVKLTTARAVAERALRRAFAGDGLRPYRRGSGRPVPAVVEGARETLRALAASPAAAADRLLLLAREEAVVKPDDLSWRRTDWSEEPGFEELAARVPDLLATASPMSETRAGGS